MKQRKTNKRDEILKRLALAILALILSSMFAILATLLSYAAAAETHDTWICEEYQGYIEEISAEYGICPELITAIIEAESSGNPEAVRGSCKGLMQVSERWHSDRMERLGVTDLYDPYSNILVATDYIMELAEEYGDLAMVLMIYNGSSDAEERWENGYYTEYATSIMERSAELERIHGK